MTIRGNNNQNHKSIAHIPIQSIGSFYANEGGKRGTLLTTIFDDGDPALDAARRRSTKRANEGRTEGFVNGSLGIYAARRGVP